MELKENMSGNNFLIAYPDDGTINEAVTWGNGQLHINFKEGKVTLPDGSQVTLKKRLEKTSQQYIRSFMFKMSSSCDIAIGQALNQRIQTKVGGWHVFENIQAEELTFYFDSWNSANVPDAQEFQIVAATSSKMPYKPQITKNNRMVNKSTTHTADAYVSYYIQDVSHFEKHTIQVRATTQDAKYAIFALASEDATSQGWNTIQGVTVLAAGAVDVIYLDGAYKRLWINAANNAAGVNTTFSCTVNSVG